MMRVYPVVRAKIETLLSAADPLFDPSRLTLGTKHHAVYFAGESASALAGKTTPRCNFASVSASGSYLNFNLSAAYLGGFMAAFFHAPGLPSVTLTAGVTEKELFSPVLYAALRLHAFASKEKDFACPRDDAAKDALFAVYGLAEPLSRERLRSKAEHTALLLLPLYKNIPQTIRKERLIALSGLASLGSRALFAAYLQLE